MHATSRKRHIELDSAPRRPRSASIFDVAQGAGVSTATVSRVLNGSAGVLPQNVDAVKRAIEACHYEPNLNAIRLAHLRNPGAKNRSTSLPSSRKTQPAEVVAEPAAIVATKAERDTTRERFTKEQIVRILNEHEAGRKIAELAQEHGISKATLYGWRSRYRGMETGEPQRLQDLEEENRRLKQLVADLSLDKEALRALIRKNG
jgi:putative transposase